MSDSDSDDDDFDPQELAAVGKLDATALGEKYFNNKVGQSLEYKASTRTLFETA